MIIINNKICIVLKEKYCWCVGNEFLSLDIFILVIKNVELTSVVLTEKNLIAYLSEKSNINPNFV